MLFLCIPCITRCVELERPVFDREEICGQYYDAMVSSGVYTLSNAPAYIYIGQQQLHAMDEPGISLLYITVPVMRCLLQI